MATFGVDNFIGELSIDGSTANFHFTDPDDVHNVADVNISPKEFPEGVVSPDSREVSDYAYSLVAEKMNAARSERLKAAELQRVSEAQDAETVAKAVTAQHFKDAQDNTVAPAGTETRADGVKQTVYNTAEPTDNAASSKKK
jgi:hypothetical protein